MSEINPHTEQVHSPEAQAILRYEQSYLRLAESIPELDARPEILQAGKELIEQLEIQDSLFDDEGRQVLFTAIASKWAEVKDGLRDDDLESERLFIGDTLALLAPEHSPKLADAKQQIQKEKGGFDDETKALVYEKYTDKPLSKEITKYMQGDQFASVKESLGITPDNEDAFEVRVLTISDSMQTFGLDAPSPDYSLPFRSPELQAAMQLSSDVKNWKDGLEARGRQFNKDLGLSTEQVSVAWVTTVADKRTLCISMPLAEKILDPTLTEHSRTYQEMNDRAGDIATLQHEYTHTQGGLNVDRKVLFGINLEELRAEHFSGNKQGYQEIKGFFQGYHAITGHSIQGEFNSREKGGSMKEIYGAIANNVGLSKMLDVTLAMPTSYLQHQGNSFLDHAFEHIGGLDGVLKGLYADAVEKNGEEAINERLDAQAATISNIAKDSPDFINFFENYRKSMGLSFITEKVTQRARQMTEKTAVS